MKFNNQLITRSIKTNMTALKTEIDDLELPIEEFKNYKRVKVKKVEKVIDGDTLRVKFDNDTSVKLRLLMVDTPELDSQNKRQLYATNAMDFVKVKVRKAKEITIARDNQLWDHYGRLLAYVYVDDELIQELLLKEGLARTCDLEGKSEDMVKRFVDLELEAMIARKKIWGVSGYVTAERGFNDEVKKKRRRGKRGKKKKSTS